MSDEESSDEEMSDNDQPPALEDADIDDLSSGASVVTDSSDSVSLQTSDEEDQSYASDDSTEGSMDDDDRYSPNRGKLDFHDSTVAPSFIVPLNLGSDSEDEAGGGDDTNEMDISSPQGRLARRSCQEKEDALQRNSMRRQASNEMLAAMQAATRQNAEESSSVGRGFERQPPARTRSGDGMATGSTRGGDGSGPRRRPPPRTKSGDMMNGNGDSDDKPRRRPPPRTKSGDGMDASVRRRPPARTKSGDGMDAPTRRRPPPRTKSGDGFNAGQSVTDRPARRSPSAAVNLGEPTESGDFVVPLQGGSDDDADTDVLLSPSGRRRRTAKEREKAMSRNAVRRQQSSDMLSAMRAATRSAPSRAKSSGAALMRRAPPRTKSGEGLVGASDDREPRRRPPPRTKSGDGLQGESSSAPPRRRPPQRTKSGDGFASKS